MLCPYITEPVRVRACFRHGIGSWVLPDKKLLQGKTEENREWPLRPFASKRLGCDGTQGVRDFAVSSPHFPGSTGLAVALIRKRLQGRIFNGWLVAITVLGALIV